MFQPTKIQQLQGPLTIETQRLLPKIITENNEQMGGGTQQEQAQGGYMVKRNEESGFYNIIKGKRKREQETKGGILSNLPQLTAVDKVPSFDYNSQKNLLGSSKFKNEFGAPKDNDYFLQNTYLRSLDVNEPTDNKKPMFYEKYQQQPQKESVVGSWSRDPSPISLVNFGGNVGTHTG